VPDFCRLIVTVVVLSAAGCTGARAPDPAADVADAAPVAPGVPAVFAPGVISGPSRESVPAFTPDGNTVYFTRDNAILVAHRHGTSWSAPEVAPFSGRWGDWEPAMSPDGAFLIFVSNRPAVEPGAALDGEWGYPTRTVFKTYGGNLWRVERRGDSWGTPVRLPDMVNRGTGVWEPSIVADGSLYFMDAHLPGRFRIYRSQYRGGSYQEPQQLPFSDGTWSDVDATVAPDESFLVIASNRPPVEGQRHELFLAFRDAGGGWGPLRHLGPAVNDATADQIQPRLGPDRHTLYFTSGRTTPIHYPRSPAVRDADLRRAQTWDNGASNIWQVDLSPWLRPAPGGGPGSP